MVILPIAVAVVLFVGLEVRTSWRYRIAVHDADAAFESSRGNVGTDPDSPSFMVRGLRRGMTTDAVDELMKDAKFKSRPAQPTLPGGIMGRLYRFTYGKPFTDPFTGKTDILLGEELYVYFDAKGQATRVVYHRFGRGKWDMINQDIDLAGLP